MNQWDSRPGLPSSCTKDKPPSHSVKNVEKCFGWVRTLDSCCSLIKDKSRSNSLKRFPALSGSKGKQVRKTTTKEHSTGLSEVECTPIDNKEKDNTKGKR